MIDAGIVVVSLWVLLLSMGLYRLAAGEPVWRLNMLSYSFWILFLFSFVCSIVVALDRPILGYKPEVMGHLFRGSSDPRLKVWAMVMWMFLTLPIGGIIANVLGVRSWGTRAAMLRYRSAELAPSLGVGDRTLFRILTFASVIVLGVVLTFMPSNTALMNVLATGDIVGSQVVRNSSSYGTGNALIDGLVNYGTLELLSFAAFCMALVTRRLKWWLLFGPLFAASVFVSLSRGTVTHVLYYFAGLGFVRVCLGGEFLRLKEAIVIAVSVALLFGLFKGAEGSIFQILATNVYTRIVYSQLLGSYVAFDVFPARHEFLGFSSTARWAHDLTGRAYSPSYGIVTMGYYNPEGVAAGSAGHFTTIFMGEAWANFGLVGILIAPFFVGWVVQSVNWWFLNRPKTVIAIAFYAYLATTFEYASALIGFYYPLGTAFFIIGSLVLLYLSKTVIVAVAGGLRASVQRGADPVLVLRERG